MAASVKSNLVSIVKKHAKSNQQAFSEHADTPEAPHHDQPTVIANKLQQLKIMVSEEVNINKVNKIKAALEADRYTWDPERVAGSLLNLDRELAETE